jgi:hypothetical protein
MRIAPLAVLLLTLLPWCLHQAVCGAEERTYELGGLRQVKATVRVADKNYEVAVHMLAVRCFDDATNREVNRQMARTYALQGLARHLTNKRQVEMVVSGAQITRSGAQGKRFALQLSVPRDGVNLVKQGEALPSSKPASPRAERTVVTGSLFQRKGQYEQTIAQLEKVQVARLRDLVARARQDDLDADALARQVARLRKGFEDNAGQLGKEIKADNELFSIGSDLDPKSKSEKALLLEALSAARARFGKRCDEALERYRTKTSQEAEQ